MSTELIHGGEKVSAGLVFQIKSVLSQCCEDKEDFSIWCISRFSSLSLTTSFWKTQTGQCRSTGDMVAIKILKNCDHNGQIVKNELRLLQVLREGDTKDSHIVHFLEAFSHSVWTYLVFELLQQNLFDFQKQNNFSPLPVRHIRTITAQVLVALVKLKELSIIHADLKPENIMLVDHARYPFRIKLVDFGSAILLPEVCHVQEPYIQTRFYRAPEILLGLPFCEKVDIWSLGCVMAELHLGWPLYPGNDEYDQVCYICSTLGLPRGELLCAAQKTRSFFQLVNVCPMPDPDQEELAKRCDLYRMVELLKRMLTWDSRERITPSAALHHPFISMQEVKASFEATRYYQLSQEDLRASCKDSSLAKVFLGTEKGAFIPWSVFLGLKWSCRGSPRTRHFVTCSQIANCGHSWVVLVYGVASTSFTHPQPHHLH
uniref:Homeodomain interacting protein kinase 4 n=1 Tax=Cyanoderma ruficeps TaxID=181631 RepID=A0A8C3QSR7_9PASS